ncbi:MAG: hypothetical protein WD749_06615 [Phycisphaerales bacterium]
MTWRIDVAAVCRPALRALDPLLYQEVRERVADIPDDPLPQLRMASSEEGPSMLVLDYESDVIHDLRVLLLFADIDLGERRIVLMDVRTVTPARDDTD